MGRRIMDMLRADPKGLVRESYAIEGITIPECRSIFLDWALSLPPGIDQREAMRAVLAHYGTDPGHPMSLVIAEGLAALPDARRRGGRAGRFASPD